MRTDSAVLAGGTANRGRVVRVADTVHRPAGAHTAAVHDLLRHLEASGFTGAPRVVARHASTEVLGYIEGRAATTPLADWALSDEALASVGQLLREYHRHAAGFEPATRVWQGSIPRRWQGSLVAHNDVHPANVVFRDGRAVALIDFDLAAPATAAWDLAVAACGWTPLRDAVDIDDERRDQRLRRFRLLLDAYGAAADLRSDVAAAVPDANAWISRVIEQHALDGHPAFGRLWEREHEMHQRAAVWLADRTGELGSPWGGERIRSRRRAGHVAVRARSSSRTC